MRGYNPAALKRARKAAGLTQGEVAQRADIARPNCVNFENGKRVPGTYLLGRFADAVGVETRDLVRLDPEKTMLRDLRVLAGRTCDECAAILGYRGVRPTATLKRRV